jgi:hypothetical protein
MIFLISLNKKEINYNVFLIQRFLFFKKKKQYHLSMESGNQSYRKARASAKI